MHDQHWHDIQKAVQRLAPDEKRELIDEINRSLSGDTGHRSSATTSEQKQAVMELLEEVEQLPMVDEPADGLVASRDHDTILYERSRKAARQENPRK